LWLDLHSDAPRFFPADAGRASMRDACQDVTAA